MKMTSLICLVILLGPLKAHSQNDEIFDASMVEEKRKKISVGPSNQKKSRQRDDDFSPVDAAKPITLKGAIEQGLRQNPDERIRDFDRELLHLKWQDTYEAFWYPNIQLQMTTDSTQRIDKWKTGNTGTTQPTEHTSTGTFGVNLGEYTLFNWGKDYLDYLNSRSTFVRSRRILKESRRDLKHDIIDQYFELNLAKIKLRIYQDQLRHASFIYRHGREKASIRKLSKHQYYQARNEYLRAQYEYQEAKNTAKITDEQFAYFMGDDLSTTYAPRDSLTTKRLALEMNEAFKLGYVNAPTILTAQTSMENSQRSYEKTLKENLPLPKLSVDLGTYAHSFSKDSNSKRYETFSGSKNIELVASINATWAITGEDGFLNTRKTRTSLLEKQKAERLFYDARRSVESEIRKLFKQINYFQKQIDITKLQYETAQKNFDTHLQSYLNNKSRFIDLKDALLLTRDTEIALEEAKYYHLKKKLELAKTIGVEDFPGESFEEIGKTEVKKR